MAKTHQWTVVGSYYGIDTVFINHVEGQTPREAFEAVMERRSVIITDTGTHQIMIIAIFPGHLEDWYSDML